MSESTIIALGFFGFCAACVWAVAWMVVRVWEAS
jgi:hypothetical protein